MEIIEKIKIKYMLSVIRQIYYSLIGVKFCGIVFIGPRVSLDLKKNGRILFEKRVYLKDDIHIICYGNLSIGENTSISSFSYIVSMENLTIGKNVLISERVSIRDHDHDLSKKGININKSGYLIKPVSIGDNCWIGCNVTITKGVSIGNNCIVGANSVVTKDVPDNSVVVGSPAKIIKKL